MIADAKSRFANIVDEIVLDTDEFIKAITDAINLASGDNVSSTPKKSTKPTPTPKPEPEEDSEVADEQIDEDLDLFDEDETPQEEAVVPVDKETLTEIRSNFKSADSDTKSRVRTVLSHYNGKLSSEMRPSDIEKIKTILGI